jgi:hypothetical protein
MFIDVCGSDHFDAYMGLPTAASMDLELRPPFAHTMIIDGTWPEPTAL